MSRTDYLPSAPGTPAVTLRPARCRCARMVVADLTDTLSCPGLWYAVDGIGWIHILGGAR